MVLVGIDVDLLVCGNNLLTVSTREDNSYICYLQLQLGFGYTINTLVYIYIYRFGM